ncbi:MAG TPA: glycosyltransferase [Streptosporangiaceae bacterium]|nr:glycosyltransferase [Streptosporangiaceae bacterium]
MLVAGLELFLIAIGLTYYLGTAGVGLLLMWGSGWRGKHAQLRRRMPGDARPPGQRSRRHPHRRPRNWSRRPIAASEKVSQLLLAAEDPVPRASLVAMPEDLVTYFLVPCLNEELVIERTVRRLLANRQARVVVIDDASDDSTGHLSAAIDPDRVIVVRRELPEARIGKGPALNTGLAAVVHDAARRRIAASRIVICVMDADGELSPGALHEVQPLFCDSRIGGVQLQVRIRNTSSLLTVLQDLEFWGVAAIGQIGRNATGTVSLGGNGQFTRLTALLELGRDPWRRRLTEDLDLGLALASAGWRLVCAPRAYVSQQGVPTLRALIRQRTRWYQGHMEAAEWFGPLWRSQQVSHLGMLEMLLYLMLPWALVLPWSILFNYNLTVTVEWLLGWAPAPPIGTDLTEQASSIVAWYLLSFLPIWTAGYMYYRQRRRIGLARALLFAHILLIGNYITYLACWRALIRLVTRRKSWQKTDRIAEKRSLRPAAPAALAPAGPGPR